VGQAQQQVTPTPQQMPTVVAPIEVLDSVEALRELRELEAQFPRVAHNTNPIIPGGDFHMSIGLATQLGPIHPHLSTDTFSSSIGSYHVYSLLPWTDSGRILLGREGHVAPVFLEMDIEALTATYTFRDGVYIYWTDGVLLTLDDLKYAFEFISHPDYTGVRFGASNGTVHVRGAAAFKAGEVDHIEGLVLSDDMRTLTVHFETMPPGLMFGILSTPIPRHHFEGISVAETASHINARDNFLGFGPFILDVHVPGESIILVANENYWRGRPNLDRIVYTPIDAEFASEAMRAGNFDVMGFRLQDWEHHGDMNNVTFLGQIGSGQGPLLHFVLGEMHQDADTGELYLVPRDDGHPITDRVFRHAMSLAIDRLAIDVNFNQGFGRPATSILSPFHGEEYIDPTMAGMSIFDLDLANQMLDDAGYLMGPDGFRLDLNGEPFHVNFAIWHTATNEIIFAMHQQNMAEIGIDFRLYDEMWIDWNVLTSYIETVHGIHPEPQSRNTDMHMLQMSWSHGSNPNPRWLWGDDQTFNFSKFTAPDFQEPLTRMDSMEAWDPDFFRTAIMDFARVFDYYRPAITASWSVGLTMVNHRVANYDILRGWFLEDQPDGWHRVGLTADRPIPHQD
jgi:peptide/nickel transport system substrate-binding protein